MAPLSTPLLKQTRPNTFILAIQPITYFPTMKQKRARSVAAAGLGISIARAAVVDSTPNDFPNEGAMRLAENENDPENSGMYVTSVHITTTGDGPGPAPDTTTTTTKKPIPVVTTTTKQPIPPTGTPQPTPLPGPKDMIINIPKRTFDAKTSYDMCYLACKKYVTLQIIMSV